MAVIVSKKIVLPKKSVCLYFSYSTHSGANPVTNFVYCELPDGTKIYHGNGTGNLNGSGNSTGYAFVKQGDIVKIYVKGYSSTKKGTVTVDGTTVYENANNGLGVYEYTVEKDVSIKLETNTTAYQGTDYIGIVTITTR